jgi:hypothetical protein
MTEYLIRTLFFELFEAFCSRVVNTKVLRQTRPPCQVVQQLEENMSLDLPNPLRRSQLAPELQLAAPKRTRTLRSLVVFCGFVVVATLGAMVGSSLLLPAPASAQTKMGKKGGGTVKKGTGTVPKGRKAKTTRKKKKKKTGVEGIYFRYGLGFGGCLKDADANAACPAANNDWGPGFVDVELGYRQKLLGVELQISQNEYQITDERARTFDSSFLYGGVGIKVFPNQRRPFDPYFGLRLGGMSVSRDDVTDPVEEGFMFSVVGGLDYLFSQNFGVGTAIASHWLQGQEDTASFWTWRASFIVYFDASGSSKSKKTAAKKRPKKRTPKY